MAYALQNYIDQASIISFVENFFLICIVLAPRDEIYWYDVPLAC